MANIDAFLRLMLEQRASDLHFISGSEPVLRIDGDLLPINYREIKSAECLNFVREILPPHVQRRFEQRMDVDFSWQLEDKARFRVNVFQHREGVGATFRLIPMTIPSIEELHLPMQLLEFPVHRKGFVLVTGPTGSGKSTTLATLIDYINTNSRRHILTIENPIEFTFKHKQSLMTQCEVGLHTDSFETALHTASRGFADVILVSELPNIETISLALTAADTGSLVFATLNTQSCASAISRLIDSYPPDRRPRIRSMLSVSLLGIINQTLVRRINYRGRVPVIELMTGSPELAHLIREGQTHQIQTYFESADPTRNILHDQSLLQLYTNELITLDTAISTARDPKKFEAMSM